MNKVFCIKIKGFWMGGVAVIRADSQEQAIAILEKAHTKELSLEGRCIISIEKVLSIEPILYYWDGDY